MTDRIQIRKARKSDLETLANFNTLMAWEDGGQRTLTAGYSGRCREPPEAPEYGFYLLAEVDGEAAVR
jgi:hypothetical protein